MNKLLIMCQDPIKPLKLPQVCTENNVFTIFTDIFFLNKPFFKKNTIILYYTQY